MAGKLWEIEEFDADIEIEDLNFGTHFVSERYLDYLNFEEGIEIMNETLELWWLMA